VVVVDLKTTKHPPTDKEMPDHPQLGLYQHAVAHGAVDHLVADVVEGPATAGGAELVHLRKGLAGGAKVQQQGPQQPDEDGRTTVERQLMRAAAVARGEVLDATPGKHCDHCSFHAVCPTKAAGTVLS
jgi:RecB family exonuclease